MTTQIEVCAIQISAMNSYSLYLLWSSQNELPQSKEMNRLLARTVEGVKKTSNLCTALRSCAAWSVDISRRNSRIQLRSTCDLPRTTSQISSANSRNETFNQVSTLGNSLLECFLWPTRRRMQQGGQRNYRQSLKLRSLIAHLLTRSSLLVTQWTCFKSKT